MNSLVLCGRVIGLLLLSSLFLCPEQLIQRSTGPLGILAEYCVVSGSDNTVVVTLPDGEVHRFRTVAEPACNLVTPELNVTLAFEALDGTHSRLEALDGKHGRLVNNALVADDTPIDPPDLSAHHRRRHRPRHPPGRGTDRPRRPGQRAKPHLQRRRHRPQPGGCGQLPPRWSRAHRKPHRRPGE